jgi:hypothetical protein
MADADIQTELARFHTGDSPPKVTHYLAIDRETTAFDAGREDVKEA